MPTTEEQLAKIIEQQQLILKGQAGFAMAMDAIKGIFGQLAGVLGSANPADLVKGLNDLDTRTDEIHRYVRKIYNDIYNPKSTTPINVTATPQASQQAV